MVYDFISTVVTIGIFSLMYMRQSIYRENILEIYNEIVEN